MPRVLKNHEIDGGLCPLPPPPPPEVSDEGTKHLGFETVNRFFCKIFDIKWIDFETQFESKRKENEVAMAGS